MEYKKVKNFCWYKYDLDECLAKKFKEDDGYILLLSLIRKINEYANEIDCVVRTINILESWKNKEFFDKKETTYEIDWFGTKNKCKQAVTLSESKKIYREIKAKYDALYELFVDASQVHYEEDDALINKYFSFGN